MPNFDENKFPYLIIQTAVELYLANYKTMVLESVSKEAFAPGDGGLVSFRNSSKLMILTPHYDTKTGVTSIREFGIDKVFDSKDQDL